MSARRGHRSKATASVRLARLALPLVVLLRHGDAAGQSQFTQNEYRALPRACLAQTFIHSELRFPVVPEQERKQWEATLGESYIHYHHYCWGLMLMRRAAADPKRSEFNYRNAVEAFQYVIRNSRDDFALLPEVYLRKGMALRMLEDLAGAAKEFLSAVRLKPDYTPAYAGLIEVHIDLGDVDGARSVLATGLKYAPESKILKAKQKELREIR